MAASSKNPDLAELCALYVCLQGVYLPSDFYVEPAPRSLFPDDLLKNRDVKQILQQGNWEHVKLATHLPSGRQIIFSYTARMASSVRVTSALKKIPGFQWRKLIAGGGTILNPFMRYLPDFLDNGRRRKQDREAFSGKFHVFLSTAPALDDDFNRYFNFSEFENVTSPEPAGVVDVSHVIPVPTSDLFADQSPNLFLK